MFEIVDDNGTIHSGSEGEMHIAFDIMVNPDNYTKEEVKEWEFDWSGDLKLIQIHQVER